ncbi:hypothetical protein [Amycolatopsis benzoatilytica]|uniref:hypothetical protein n=1 Tax=Amycolatopsis benzoatilytica TaxID=346045 RepID=UPI0003A0BF40|nr:hypothetical protein [Amycolatopsis benzoatilytica]
MKAISPPLRSRGNQPWLSRLRELCARFDVPIDHSGVGTPRGTRWSRLATVSSALVGHRDRISPPLRRLLALAERTSREQDWCACDPVRRCLPEAGLDAITLPTAGGTIP